MQRVCVLGGSGFVGTYLVAELSRRGYAVRVLTRQREKHRRLLVLPGVEVRNCRVHDKQQLTAQLAGCDAVINLVGILHASRRVSFEKAHVELPKTIIAACVQAGVPRLLHMSALNASLEAGSKYLRSKGEGELYAMDTDEHGMRVTVFRPAVIFGPEDGFFNRFYALIKLSPVLPLACATVKFAPVYVGDVAMALCQALRDPRTVGHAYDLCGPQSFTLREIIDMIMRLTGERRWVMNLGPFLSRLQAGVLQWFPGKPFTPDNFKSLQVDSTCRGTFPSVFGFKPTMIESVVPAYLARRTSRQQYQRLRSRAHR